MVKNEDMPASRVEAFAKEAQSRGVYTKAQDSLVSTWRTLASLVLPDVGVDIEKTTVGQLKEQLPELLKKYGGKGTVKAGTVDTYASKGDRILKEFCEYHGATDAKWYEWKATTEKKSRQAASAASSRFNPKKRPVDDPAPLVEAPADTSSKRHTLRLAGNRTAELVVPASLAEADIKKLEKGFEGLIGYLRSQIDITDDDE